MFIYRNRLIKIFDIRKKPAKIEFAGFSILIVLSYL